MSVADLSLISSVTFVFHWSGHVVEEFLSTRVNPNTRMREKMLKDVYDVLFLVEEIAYLYVSFGQVSSLLWTHTLRPFYIRPIALTQEGRSLVNDLCECVRD